MNYPARDSHFAHKFTRLLQKSCAAMDIGQSACLLLVYIAHTEDAARYSGPVRFWNEQLMTTLGFRSPKQLNAAREAAIEDGWLVYDRKHTRAVGRYFVTIPEQFEDLTDAVIEDNLSAGGTNSGTNSGKRKGTRAERERAQERKEKGTESGKPSNPVPRPVPDPSPKERARSQFKPPEIDEVRAYCTERANTVDAETFVDFNQSKGWVIGKSKMKDWKAAVRTWEKRENHNGNGKPTSRSIMDTLDDMIEEEKRNEQF